MSEHRGTEKVRRTNRFGSGRIRALLSLGIALGLGAVGTFAFWTDDVVISGSTFTAGTLDLKVNNSDAYATTTLGMTAMVPGNTSAELLTIKNAGTAALKYTLVGGLTGTDAALYNTLGVLKLTILSGATISGTGNAATCTGGTSVYTATALTNVTTTAIIATRRGPIAAAGTEVLCFQVTFDAGASTTLQGKTATATFTATGTSDVS
jgi:predicted ribosomally synthesized peptide with SipW-like signal peptide